MHETLEFESPSHRALRCRSSVGSVKEIFGRQPRRVTLQGMPKSSITFWTPAVIVRPWESCGRSFFRRTFVRVARMTAEIVRLPAKSADPPVSQSSRLWRLHDRVGDLLRETIGGARNSCADRFPKTRKSGSRSRHACSLPGRRRWCAFLVDDDKRRHISASVRGARSGTPGMGCTDADIGQGRGSASTQANRGEPRLFRSGMRLNSTTRVVTDGSNGGADIAAARFGGTAG